MMLRELGRLTIVIGLCACQPLVQRFTSATPSALTINPTVVTVAPGEPLSFLVAGGTMPYHFTFQNGSAASGAAASLDDDGHYQAGHMGSVIDVVVATDAHGQTISAQVTVGPALQLSASSATAAPGQSLSVTAAGGRAPYTFALSQSPSGATIADGTGVYVAGRTGGVTDQVTVTDYYAQSQNLDIVVGPTLSALLSSPTVISGSVNPIAVSGGLAPYRFSFAAKGNHSHGTINQQTGDYQPGLNMLTTDTLLVSDATAATTTVTVHIPPISVPVGAVGQVSGAGAGETTVDSACLAADFKGNGRPVLGLFSSVPSSASTTVNRLTTVDFSQGLPPTVTLNYPVSDQVTITQAVVADVNQDGFDDLVTASVKPANGGSHRGQLG